MIYFCQTTVFCKKALDKTTRLWYNLSCCRKAIWVWRSLVARYLGVVEAVGSNPATQTKRSRKRTVSASFLRFPGTIGCFRQNHALDLIFSVQQRKGVGRTLIGSV